MFGWTRKDRAKRLIAAICAGERRTALGLLTNDFTFIDSKNYEIAGKEAFEPYLRQFCDADLCLEIDYGELGVSGDQILMSGNQTSCDERLNARVQWQMSFRRNLVCRLQTFRAKDAPSILKVMHSAMLDSGRPIKTVPAPQPVA